VDPLPADLSALVGGACARARVTELPTTQIPLSLGSGFFPVEISDLDQGQIAVPFSLAAPLCTTSFARSLSEVVIPSGWPRLGLSSVAVSLEHFTDVSDATDVGEQLLYGDRTGARSRSRRPNHPGS
jgi:hypothetical protein